MNTVAIEEIVIRKRFREDLGDIGDLTASIEDLGLLHPIVITSKMELIAGMRRIAAFKELGRTEIPATIVDMENILKGQFDENKMRKDFTPSEAVALWMTMENRQGERTDRGEEPRSDSDRSSEKPSARAARATSRSTDTLSKAKQVVEAAAEDPEKYGDLKEKMDREDNVDGSYQELRRRRLYEKITGESADPGKQYSVIYAFPPWEIQGVVNELKVLPVKNLAEKNAALFIWVDWKDLAAVFGIIRAWGFTYSQGYVLDNEAEAEPEDKSMLLLQCFRGSQHQESLMYSGVIRKIKAEFAKLIIDGYPGAARLQLFGKKLGEEWDYLSPRYLVSE